MFKRFLASWAGLLVIELRHRYGTVWQTTGDGCEEAVWLWKPAGVCEYSASGGLRPVLIYLPRARRTRGKRQQQMHQAMIQTDSKLTLQRRLPRHTASLFHGGMQVPVESKSF